MTYATRLRAARERRGLTQAQVAYQIGVAYSTVSAWERARQKPQDPHAKAVRELLGVDPPEREKPEEAEPVQVEAGEPYEPDLPAHPTDKRVVEEAARCCIAVAKSKGSYHGTTADDLVTAHVGADSPRWAPLMTKVRNRAREMEGRVFSCQSRTLE